MNHLALFKDALVRIEILHDRFPQVNTISSIIAQLKYLIQLDSGEPVERGRLKDIVLGIQAAREIEPLDAALADILYRVSDASKKM